MTKNILLAATAASVMAFAGAASAHTLTFRAVGAAPADITSGDTGGATSPYKLAAEAANIVPAFGTFALIDTLSVGASLPSGNSVLTITLTGGTWGTALTAGNVNVVGIPACGTFTAVPSSGGASGGTSASFLISNSSAGCGSFNLDLPVAPNAGSNVTVTTTLATEFNTPIDGLTASRQIVTRPSAFGVVIDSAIGSLLPGGGALGDTFATLTVTPVYTQFFVGAGGHTVAPETSTVGQLGTIQITVDTTAYRDLAKNFVAAGDVTDADVVVTGNYNAFNGAGGAVVLGAAPATINAGATTATINNQQAALTAAPQAFIVTRETANTPIPTSTYSANVAYTLNAAFYNQEGPVIGALETIGRDGTNVVFPWMNSSSVQTANGTTNLIRLSNITGSATGPVYGQVLNSVNSATGYTPAAGPVLLSSGIPANGEVVLNTATLTTNLGNFGRGDVQISIEAPPTSVTARRYATLANGSITEFESGTVANDQGVGIAGVTPQYIP